jgi:tRNA pseudouridine32 synthase/23S rRNA pseudouridine746 synthase
MLRFSLKKQVGPGDPKTVCEFLAQASGLSKSKVKDAMNKGAAWRRRRGRRERIRRATAPVRAGEALELHYDQRLLSIEPPDAELISDCEHYSVWHKPAGLMTQGTNYGDHCSLLRQAELFFPVQREAFLVHRLDREAGGLVLIAHSKVAAARLSSLFRANRIVKRYRVVVRGSPGPEDHRGVIDLPLDAKPAHTEYRVCSYDTNSDTGILEVMMKTGRLHQIRRHLDMLGYPVMGDPRYGKSNKNTEGLQLMAWSLEFVCPFSGKDMVFSVDSLTPESAGRGTEGRVPKPED